MEFKLTPVERIVKKTKALRPTAITSRLYQKRKNKIINGGHRMKVFCLISLETMNDLPNKITSVQVRQSQWGVTVVVNFRDGTSMVL